MDDSTYTVTLTETERTEILHALGSIIEITRINAECETDKKRHKALCTLRQLRTELWKKIKNTEPVKTCRTCGQCAHLVPADKAGYFYNREAFKAAPWGDCPVYKQSEEFQRKLENHFPGAGWQPAPGRAFDQPACEHFTPKKK